MRARFTLGSFGTLAATYALQYDDRREYDIVRQATIGRSSRFASSPMTPDLTLEHYPLHVADNVHLTGAAGVVGMLQSHSYRGLQLVPSHEAAGAGAFASERLWGHDYVIEASLRYDYLGRGAELLRRDFQRLVRSGQIAQDGCGVLADDADPVHCDSRFHTISASLGGLLR